MQYISGSMIAMVIGGLLTSLFGLLASISKSEKIPRWLCWCSFLAGIVVLIGGIMSGVSDAKDAAAIQNQTRQIAELSAQNTALLAGGHNYCSFAVSVHPSNTLNWTIQHRNDHVHIGDKINAPVLDVNATIWDIGKVREQGNLATREALRTLEDPNPEKIRSLNALKMLEALQNPNPNAVTHWNIGTVLPDENSIFRKTYFTDTNKLSFEVSFYARNGRWRETILLRKVAGKWLRAHKMDKTSGYCPDIRQTGVSMSSGFPTNELPSGW